MGIALEKLPFGLGKQLDEYSWCYSVGKRTAGERSLSSGTLHHRLWVRGCLSFAGDSEDCVGSSGANRAGTPGNHCFDRIASVLPEGAL